MRLRKRPKRRIPLGADLGGVPERHGVLAQVIAGVLPLLKIGVSLVDGAGEWHLISAGDSSFVFELAHGKGPERGTYNSRCLERVHRERVTVTGQYGGFSDLFVPVETDGQVSGVLVTGPIATARPTSEEILERWRWLSDRNGHPADPEFSQYLTTTLSALTLEGEQFGRYQRWLECFALLLTGSCDARPVAEEAAALAAQLEEARFVDRMWEAARTMLDERSERSWMSSQRSDERGRLGMIEPPEHVLVGLLSDRGDQFDTLDALLERDGFQRACVEIALATGSICGRVGDQGVVFVVPGGSQTRVQSTLSQITERTRVLARRRFGTKVHVGTALARPSASLGELYEQALGAAERTLSGGTSGARAEPISLSAHAVRRLRRDLGRLTEERPRALGSRFERYIEAVLARSGHRFDLVRVDLEAGFDQAAQSVLTSGMLSEKSYADTCEALDRAARDAATLGELCDAYRRAISDLAHSAEDPVRANQSRNLRRAVAFIQAHSSETLNLSRVARIAGFSPNHFSQLFKRQERMTFEKYVVSLRIERAKSLLAATDLSAERVGQLAGFPLRPYFHRAFKRVVGMTPGEYRNTRPVGRHSSVKKSARTR